jgi:hypothetical protein
MAVYIGDLFMRLGGVAYYSPTFARGGLAISIQHNIFALGATSVTVTIEHKNIEDTTWASLTSATYNATGLTSALSSGPVKEQVRLKYVVNGTNDTDSVYLNTLAPVWQPYP